MKRILVLASGRGSNFEAVLSGFKENLIKDARIIGLLTDRPDSGAEQLAQDAGIPVQVVDYKSFGSRSDFDREVEKLVDEHSPDLILALGYMRILHETLVRKYYGKIINIHPSLLPAFPGMNAQKQAYEYGVKLTGVTVHFMDDGVDTGPIILQSPVPVPEQCSLDELKRLILIQEHKVITRAVSLFCGDALKLEKRRVIIEE